MLAKLNKESLLFQLLTLTAVFNLKKGECFQFYSAMGWDTGDLDGTAGDYPLFFSTNTRLN